MSILSSNYVHTPFANLALTPEQRARWIEATDNPPFERFVLGRSSRGTIDRPIEHAAYSPTHERADTGEARVLELYCRPENGTHVSGAGFVPFGRVFIRVRESHQHVFLDDTARWEFVRFVDEEG